jgi:hypothetical protein
LALIAPWTHGEVLFVILHVLGSSNNLGRLPEGDAEYAKRNAANLVWLKQAFELAKRNIKESCYSRRPIPPSKTTIRT